MALTLTFFAWAAAGQPTIEAPAPRFVSPGDYVTLVFILHPSTTGLAAVTFTGPQRWQLLGGTTSVDVTAGTAAPLAVTVAVPPGAQANTPNAIRLSVRVGAASTTASVNLHILPQPSISLAVPKQVPIDTGEITATIGNTGNVPLKLTASLTLGSTTLDTRKLSLDAQATTTLAFKVVKGGSYDVSVSGPGGIEESRSVVVLAYGVPSPPPFTVATRVSSYLATDGTWSLDVSGLGPLSDYARLSTHLSADAPTTSFVEVDGSSWAFRAGSSTTAPFSLGLPSALGVSAQYGGDAWAAFAAVGNSTGNQWAGYGGGAWIDGADHLYLAAAGGMDGGSPAGAVAVHQSLKHLRVTSRALWKGATLAVSTQADLDRGPATLRLGAEVGPDPSGQPSANLYVGYAASGTALTANGSVDLMTARPTTALVGLSVPLPATPWGQPQLDAQAGLDTSFVKLADATTLGAWTVTGDLGLDWDQLGQGASIGTSWQMAGTNYLGVDARARVGFDGTGVRVGLGTRGQFAVGPFLIFGGARADGIGQSASLRAGAQWQSGRFRAALTGDVSAPYVDPWSNLAASVQLRASYAFPVPVPAAVTTLAGGRRVGTVRGKVEGASGVRHLVVLVGSYRLRVAPDGTFLAELPPGSYRVRLSPASVPVTYQIEQPSEITVTVQPKNTQTVTLRVVRSAGVTGRVLLDSNGDGKPDEPARGVAGTVSLVDAGGATHSAVTGTGGGFAFRGLPPGKATLSVSGLPLGDQVEGPSERTAKITAGADDTVTILVRAATVTARVFGSSEMAIRSVTPESERVPPGSDPLVTVRLSGRADAVTLKASNHEVAMSGSGPTWTGRVPVPLDAKTGLFTFSVTARRGSNRRQRTGRLLVDPTVPLMSVDVPQAARPHNTLTVDASVLARATRVEVDGPPGSGLHARLAATTGGRWSGGMTIPAGARPGRYDLTVVAYDGKHVLATVRATAVVLAPAPSRP